MTGRWQSACVHVSPGSSPNTVPSHWLHPNCFFGCTVEAHVLLEERISAVRLNIDSLLNQTLQELIVAEERGGRRWRSLGSSQVSLKHISVKAEGEGGAAGRLPAIVLPHGSCSRSEWRFWQVRLAASGQASNLSRAPCVSWR